MEPDRNPLLVSSPPSSDAGAQCTCPPGSPPPSTVAEAEPAPAQGVAGPRAARIACIIPRDGGEVICGELVDPPPEHDDDE